MDAPPHPAHAPAAPRKALSTLRPRPPRHKGPPGPRDRLAGHPGEIEEVRRPLDAFRQGGAALAESKRQAEDDPAFRKQADDLKRGKGPANRATG